MLMLASMIGLLVMGAAVDTTALTTDETDDRHDPDLPDQDGAEPETPDPASDPIWGTDEAEWLTGGWDDDRIDAGAGDDDVRAGLGHDRVMGGAGHDVLYGDDAYGAGGNDTVLGGNGDDSVVGDGGDDRLHGGTGRDSLFGGDGADSVIGGAGEDWVAGGAGNDTLIAGQGPDDLSGDDGDDLLVAGRDGQVDYLHGGAGEDTLAGSAGDWLEGGTGADRFDLPGDAAPKGAPATLADFDTRADSIHLTLPPDAPAQTALTLDHLPDGSALIVMNGQPVAHVLNAHGLAPGHIAIHRAGALG